MISSFEREVISIEPFHPTPKNLAFNCKGQSPDRIYKIWIERIDDDYRIVKENGMKGRVLDRRCWPVEDLDDAQTKFQRRVKAKTNPERKSPRKYTLVQSS